MTRDEHTPRERRTRILRWVVGVAVWVFVAGASFLDGHLLLAFAWGALGASLLSSAMGLRERSAVLRRATQLVEIVGLLLAAAALYARLAF